MLGGILFKLELPAAAHLLVDVWNGNFAKFHKKMRSPSAYGGFRPPHPRHEMCLHACTDTLLGYQAARSADLKAQLPLFLSSSISSRRIVATANAPLRKRST
eukprot:5406080-Pleurochrysis_carterae.AAC.3